MTGNARSDNDNEDGNGHPLPPSGHHVRDGLGREPLRPPLPKRFYTQADVVPAGTQAGAGWAVRLDGRPVKTPAKAPLVLVTRDLAQAIAEEWAAQGTHIDPSTMPLTRLANTTIDAVAISCAAVAADIVAFAATDALCYRAHPTDPLAERQARTLDPVLAWAAQTLGARLTVTAGVCHVAQPTDAVAAIGRALEPLSAWQIAPLHVMTTLTGSAILALAVACDHLGGTDAWTAAHIDEDWQIERWGGDAEAAERRAARKAEFDAACRFLVQSRA